MVVESQTEFMRILSSVSHEPKDCNFGEPIPSNTRLNLAIVFSEPAKTRALCWDPRGLHAISLGLEARVLDTP
jgi:hypothetical protein